MVLRSSAPELGIAVLWFALSIPGAQRFVNPSPAPAPSVVRYFHQLAAAPGSMGRPSLPNTQKRAFVELWNRIRWERLLAVAPGRIKSCAGLVPLPRLPPETVRPKCAACAASSVPTGVAAA